ncbi:hypothetical protein [Providencia manganoxydans]|uniref:hypothetical protein n=1 Tax=Providencia manganoxydans TaxID=2923283 RepID=UPI0029BFACB3|nr:hypothetical protein [Providencia manganoxydans]MDX4946491.1 hypothetical protein [Providencia manganoxydans]
MSDKLPAITNPLGKHWKQPNPANINIDDTHAMMSSSDYELLADYSGSVPSGVYVGKMWKAVAPSGKAFLRWFGIVPERDDVCSNNQREILIVD